MRPPAPLQVFKYVGWCVVCHRCGSGPSGVECVAYGLDSWGEALQAARAHLAGRCAR